VSQENVEIVQASSDAYNAGNIDAMMDFYSPDVEAFPDTGFPDARPLHGREEFRRWVLDIGEAWVSARWEASEVRAVGADRVLERGEWGGVGAGSSIETFASYTIIYTIRDGQIRRLEWFSDHADALKAVGLEE
jgi:ketosteroid isomerase-like protein